LGFFASYDRAALHLGAPLHTRDLRKFALDKSLLMNEAEMLVRRQLIMLIFHPLRAIILWDRVLILVSEETQGLIEAIEQKICPTSRDPDGIGVVILPSRQGDRCASGQ
jgi:hypothetical protein